MEAILLTLGIVTGFVVYWYFVTGNKTLLQGFVSAVSMYVFVALLIGSTSLIKGF